MGVCDTEQKAEIKGGKTGIDCYEQMGLVAIKLVLIGFRMPNTLWVSLI